MYIIHRVIVARSLAHELAYTKWRKIVKIEREVPH